MFLGIFSRVSNQRKIENITAKLQNSSGPEPIDNDFDSPNHTSLSFYHIDPLNGDINYEDTLSVDARQAVIPHPFFGQSGDRSYGNPLFPYLYHGASI